MSHSKFIKGQQRSFFLLLLPYFFISEITCQSSQASFVGLVSTAGKGNSSAVADCCLLRRMPGSSLGAGVGFGALAAAGTPRCHHHNVVGRARLRPLHSVAAVGAAESVDKAVGMGYAGSCEVKVEAAVDCWYSLDLLGGVDQSLEMELLVLHDGVVDLARRSFRRQP